MRKAASRKRINTLEKARRKAKSERKVETPSRRFDRMRAFTSSMGISDESLREAMRGEKDMSKILDKLKIITPGQGAVRHKAAFTGDGLYEEAPEPYEINREGIGGEDSYDDFRVENEPDIFRPVLRTMDRGSSGFGRGQQSVTSRVRSRELGNSIRDIQHNQARVVDQPYTFPNTDFDFDMLGAIQSSIANYEKKKNMFNVKGGGSVYSPISNQL